jgi:hypothetical protein
MLELESFVGNKVKLLSPKFSLNSKFMNSPTLVPNYQLADETKYNK